MIPSGMRRLKETLKRGAKLLDASGGRTIIGELWYIPDHGIGVLQRSIGREFVAFQVDRVNDVVGRQHRRSHNPDSITSNHYR